MWMENAWSMVVAATTISRPAITNSASYRASSSM